MFFPIRPTIGTFRVVAFEPKTRDGKQKLGPLLNVKKSCSRAHPSFSNLTVERGKVGGEIENLAPENAIRFHAML